MDTPSIVWINAGSIAGDVQWLTFSVLSITEPCIERVQEVQLDAELLVLLGDAADSKNALGFPRR